MVSPVLARDSDPYGHHIDLSWIHGQSDLYKQPEINIDGAWFSNSPVKLFRRGDCSNLGSLDCRLLVSKPILIR